MGERMSLELSDGLAEIDGLLDEFKHEPRILDPYDARILSDRIKQLRYAARALENQLSAKLWNDAARIERDAEAERIAEAAFQPGSNICLFPVIPRPFSDGRPGGAA
ncbi:hypothetical protein NKI98_17780 [Mesorhizobium sp. M0222]|uniref:hypothetical protein n=1 Tax=unclassified Mesorhizobium TaxID=325217 RepID=UPI00333B9CA7